jgi:hypothetical protein
MSAVHIRKIADDLYDVDTLKIRTRNTAIHVMDEPLLNNNQLNALTDFLEKCEQGIKINSTITH